MADRVIHRCAAVAALLAATVLAGCSGGADREPSTDSTPVPDEAYAAAMVAFGYAREEDSDVWDRASDDDLVLGGSGVVWAGAGHGSIRADQHGPTLAAGDYYFELQCYGVEIPGDGVSITWDVTVGDAPAVYETSSVSCPEGEVTTSLAPIELAKPRDGLRIEIAPLDGVTAVVDYALNQGEMPPQE
ncbi:hypothetical protein [Zhihengliuella halotolerans]|uniref:hypothetical protein n=1 Tax=Zhihengliuella halotolerans TaxID=370736 RepID=UPI000C7F92AB|nr:hypothetical protein [Zhihengliuella halotolerans]